MTATLATRPHPRAIATDPPPADPVRAWLARLTASDLPAFATPAGPAGRAPAEAEAAARAVACPDLFIVHAPEPSAGERAIVDVALLAVADRVLILTPDPAAADRIAERLASAGVVRALAANENPARPSPAVAKVTSAALGKNAVEHLKQQAAAAVVARQAEVDRLAALAARLAALDAEAADLTDRHARTEAEAVAGQTGDAAHAAMDAALAALREQQDAAAGGGKKSGFFARLLGRKPKLHGPEPAEIEKQIRTLEADIAALVVGRDNALRAETAARQAALDARLAEVAAERDQLHAGASAIDLPAERAEAERQLAAAHARQAELAAPDLVRRLLAAPRVVVGTPASLHADPVFDRDAAPFGLLVLDRAEDLTESDFSELAKLAGRWVLVGDAAHEPPQPNRNGQRNGRPGGMSFAARLARMLDRETWHYEGDRLVCRVAHLTTDQRRAMTREPLLDRPEIELRFATNAAGEPCLAEVAFLAATPTTEAKSFLFHQLNEVLLRPLGEATWHHAPAALTACWPAVDAGANATAAEWIDLEPGVKEKVAGTGPAAYTAAVAFDPAAGWTAETAAAWLADHLPPPTAGRFAVVLGK